MLALFGQSMRYNWDAHRASPANLIAATAAMVINNLIFLFGMWMMLFAGKGANEPLFPYYLAVNGLASASWGLLNLFAGGFYNLGQSIDEGSLESMLSTPRSPLLLTAISRSHPAALGDLLQGLANFVILFFVADAWIASRCLVATLIAAIAFAGVFILAGSISFFIQRGNNVGFILIECTLSLSAYPTGKAFTGMHRIFLYLTPAAATALLPIQAIEDATAGAFILATIAAGGFFYLAVTFFYFGLKRYRSTNYIGARS